MRWIFHNLISTYQRNPARTVEDSSSDARCPCQLTQTLMSWSGWVGTEGLEAVPAPNQLKTASLCGFRGRRSLETIPVHHLPGNRKGGCFSQ
jgi:hypothetical protein